MRLMLRRVARQCLAGSLVFLMSTALIPPATGGDTLEGVGGAHQGAAPGSAQAGRSTAIAAIGEARSIFDAKDEAAALEAVHLALTEVGDGSTYVWYRRGGRLSGLVQPTQSFRDSIGRICRHIVVTLNDAARSRRIESIACRLDDGGWQLDG
jgi:surface antigen